MSKPSQPGLILNYERAKQAVIDAFISSGYTAQQAQTAADNAILSQSYLRLEILLSTTSTSYQLNVLNNQNNAGANQRPTEVRLAQQDAFFASQIGVYIAKASSTTAYDFQLMTYPNTVTFPTGSGANGLQALYNGRMTIDINNQLIVPKFPMSDFYQIPQTQLTAATNSPITQFDPSEVSLLQPNINFIGSNQSTVNVVVPQVMSALDANTYLVVIFKGILAQNVTVLV